MITGPDGRQLKSISLRDPARIELGVEYAKDKTNAPEDRMIEIFTEAVVPLLLDLRTMIVDVIAPMLSTIIEQNNIHTQQLQKLIAAAEAKATVDISKLRIT